MKKELSALDLHYLVREFQILAGSKVSKVYQPQKKAVVFQLHAREQGKIFLNICLPGFIFTSEDKEDQPIKQFGFCSFLRKALGNARLQSIEQLDFERILRLSFEKEKKYLIYVELFSKGNIILCDESNLILMPLERQIWRQRRIERGSTYTYPKRDADISAMTLEQFRGIMLGSARESVVKRLAVDMGLGGTFSEELCLLSGIDKDQGSLSDDQMKSLFESTRKMLTCTPSPLIVSDAGKEIDAVPFGLKRYEANESARFSTFNEAVRTYHGQMISSGKKPSECSKRVEKIRRIIDQQQEVMTSLEENIRENTEKGELVYQNYQRIRKLIDEINLLMKEHSLSEIRSRLVEKKIIRNLDEKTKDIEIEL